MNNRVLQLNYNNDEAYEELKRISQNIPKECEVYLISGSVRNALYKKFHGEKLIQRDYDQVVIKGAKEYTEYLTKNGYIKREYPSKQNEQVIYAKALNEHAKEGDSYINWLVFDLHTLEGTSIQENIINNTAFTINGCVINMRKLFNDPLENQVIEILPGAIEDIKNKILRINPQGYKSMPSIFFAMIRFISIGFIPPPKDEIDMLLKELANLEHARFERNVKKVWDYVGGEDNARQIVKDLNIDIDIFNENEVKNCLACKKL